VSDEKWERVTLRDLRDGDEFQYNSSRSRRLVTERVRAIGGAVNVLSPRGTITLFVENAPHHQLRFGDPDGLVLCRRAVVNR
jgi:hypothetical protein